MKIKKLISNVLFALCLAGIFCGSPALVCCAGPMPMRAPRPLNVFTDERDGQKYWFVELPSPRRDSRGALYSDYMAWMMANLNYAADSGSWCYDDVVANCEIYGRLYDWETAMTACPKGWRLPSDEEWGEMFVGHWMYDPSIIGTWLKSREGWAENGNGADYHGFSALPGGGRWGDSFYDVGFWGYWWTATEDDAMIARYRVMSYGYEYVGSDWRNKSNGYSVRCVRE